MAKDDKTKTKKSPDSTTLSSPTKAAKLLITAYGEELGIEENIGAATFTKGELDRMMRWSADDPLLKRACKILQGQLSVQRPVNSVMNALSLRRIRRR